MEILYEDIYEEITELNNIYESFMIDANEEFFQDTKLKQIVQDYANDDLGIQKEIVNKLFIKIIDTSLYRIKEHTKSSEEEEYNAGNYEISDDQAKVIELLSILPLEEVLELSNIDKENYIELYRIISETKIKYPDNIDLDMIYNWLLNNASKAGVKLLDVDMNTRIDVLNESVNEFLREAYLYEKELDQEFEKSMKLTNDFNISDKYLDDIAKGGFIAGTMKNTAGLEGLNYLFSASPENDLMGMISKLSQGPQMLKSVYKTIENMIGKTSYGNNIKEVINSLSGKMKKEIISFFNTGKIKKNKIMTFLKLKRAVNSEKKKANKLPPEERNKRLMIIGAIVLLAKTAYTIYKQRDKIAKSIKKSFSIKENSEILDLDNDVLLESNNIYSWFVGNINKMYFPKKELEKAFIYYKSNKKYIDKMVDSVLHEHMKPIMNELNLNFMDFKKVINKSILGTESKFGSYQSGHISSNNDSGILGQINKILKIKPNMLVINIIGVMTTTLYHSNKDDIKFKNELIKTLAHEMRHIYQKKIKSFDIEKYSKMNNDFQYLFNKDERDARKFAKQYTKNNIYEDVYKITAIGQAGTKTSIEYDRDNKEEAKTAAIDGLDVPEKNILKIEKIDHDEPQNGPDLRDNGSKINENGDAMVYYRDHPEELWDKMIETFEGSRIKFKNWCSRSYLENMGCKGKNETKFNKAISYYDSKINKGDDK